MDKDSFVNRSQLIIAVLAILSIAAHLALRFSTDLTEHWVNLPLYLALLLGGVPLVGQLLVKLFRREFGSDLLAGISIVAAVVLHEYLAGTLVVLMLSGGEALEAYAVQNASSVLQALANRMPSIAHRKIDSQVEDVALDQLNIGDTLLVFPHEICPIDGTVIEGHGVMDESYLTGEPYMISKTPGASVLSGAINGESALTIRAEKLAVDSRYAQIMRVMEGSQQHRPHIRRLGDQLGAIYTPVAVALAVAAWIISGDPVRFLAVLVVATPCPLLIAIPVAIIGSISLAARRAIVIRNPTVLEKITGCRTVIFDKTGTLTYGEPKLTEQVCADGVDPEEVMSLVASMERYSKHPLAEAFVAAGRQQQSAIHEVTEISEKPGQGLRGQVAGRSVRVTSRKVLVAEQPAAASELPPRTAGLECVVLVDDRYAATFRFRDAPRAEGATFVQHLRPRHGVNRVMLLSGDRASEVQYLADQVGIREVLAEKSPEEKLAIVRAETAKADTLFVGDGINDAPALMAATVGIAFGQNSDVTTEAAGAVVMDSSLEKVDELMHIGRRMRSIALQSAIGGMLLSVVAMFIAAAGYLPPVAGALTQEVIDVFAVANALRVALPPRSLRDF
ncbi:heavy metal translocating P-type ATPase [Roseiconus nitratireducens]|uniref:P-type Zn(2+) transporter n=1 Tax=Roseiconus nitratireducens TaxID=2605748 RepID=A0A5M6CYI1_9BACT|nr:heavy metal translocating P-type ATPase [Roseiconus nitratireducens]KAA5539480.1 heavy metal translocating P-type ATPase [Roseiconus nitratireducens]